MIIWNQFDLQQSVNISKLCQVTNVFQINWHNQNQEMVLLQSAFKSMCSSPKKRISNKDKITIPRTHHLPLSMAEMQFFSQFKMLTSFDPRYNGKAKQNWHWWGMWLVLILYQQFFFTAFIMICVNLLFNDVAVWETDFVQDIDTQDVDVHINASSLCYKNMFNHKWI